MSEPRTTAPPVVGREWLIGIGVAVLAVVLLGVQLPADPIRGVTFSDSPFTDEGWSVLGARNFALLGTWATDEWQLFWAQLPFSIVTWLVFEAVGVGIVQARVVSLVCSAAAVGILAGLLVRRISVAAGLFGGIGLATATLFLYYGRLALLEPMVMLFLVAGLAVLLRRGDRHWLVGAMAGVLLALAIGTKPSAAVPAAGMLIGAGLAGGGIPGLRQRALVATAVIFLAAVAWCAVVLPQPGLLDTILRIWPDQPPPASPADIWDRVTTYVADPDGAISLTAPLLVAGWLGAATVWRTWAHLDGDRRALAGAAIGWLVLTTLFLLLVHYRPSRYVVPLLPSLAILAALAWPTWVGWLRGRLAPRAVTAIGVALTGAIAVQGLISVGGWVAAATYRLPAIQAELFELVTNGRPIEGKQAPTLAMRVPVPTIVSEFGINQDDLYAEYAVGWLVMARGTAPTWWEEHRDAWSGRRQVTCYDWPPDGACLVSIP